MIYIFLIFYHIIYICILIPLFAIISLFNKKIRQGFIARFSQHALLRNIYIATKNKEVILFHSASVGEWEQAIPIIKILKQENEHCIIIATFFSSSAMLHAKKNQTDYSLYLPFDIYFIVHRFLKKINPSVCIISKYDVWPSFMHAVHSLQIPTILASAELAPDSNRHKKFIAYINSLYYKYFDTIFAVSEEYKTRFLSIFPYPERIIVSGDARYDQIIEKSETIRQQPDIPIFSHKAATTFIAGSIWQADEKHLLPSLIEIYNSTPNIQCILVPHELHEQHLQAIEHKLQEANIASERYSTFSKSAEKTTTCRIAIIDTIGMLAALYKSTDIAYVGGGFSTGVHNVAEPAVLENAVLFGPKYKNSHEARLLIQSKLAKSVQNSSEITEYLSLLINEKTTRTKNGEQARHTIYAHKGAAQQISAYIQTILQR